MKLASLASYANDHLPDRYHANIEINHKHFSIFIHDGAVKRIACSWIVVPSCKLKKTIKEVKVWIAHVNML
jgi:hypothetical protein